MSWMPPPPNDSTGPWNANPNMPGPFQDYNNQWAAMQNWQQWAQYTQWQNQFGDKFMQTGNPMIGMGGPPMGFSMTGPSPALPPMPPTVPPPVPPPPDQPPPPPPPPHENNEPLFSNNQMTESSSKPNIVVQADNKHTMSNNKPGELKSQSLLQTSYNQSFVPATESIAKNNNPQYKNTSYMPEAESISNSKNVQQYQNTNQSLDSLDEEEKTFDLQLKMWEQQIEKWKKDNINHPDKKAYKEYEDKFEACRAQLLERRNQMTQKRAMLLKKQNDGINASTKTFPPVNKQVEKTNPNNYTMQKSQQLYNNQPQSNYSRNDPVYAEQSETYGNHGMDEPQERQESYQYFKDDYSSISNNMNLSNVLPTRNNEGIPGLDLVREERKNNDDVLEICDNDQRQNHNSDGPNFSTITQGINNILGDEKIMNILMKVQGCSEVNQSQHNIQQNNFEQQSNVRNQMQANNLRGNVNYQNRNNRPPLRQNNYQSDSPQNFQNRSQPNFQNQMRQPNLDRQQKRPPGDYRQKEDSHNNSANMSQNMNQREINQNRNYNQSMGQLNMQNRNNSQGNANNLSQNQVPNIQNRNVNNCQGPGNNLSQQTVPRNTMTPANQRVQPSIAQRSQPNTAQRPQPLNQNNRNASSFSQNMHQKGMDHNQVEQIANPPQNSAVRVDPPALVEEELFTPAVIVEYDHKPLRKGAAEREFIQPVKSFDYNHVSERGKSLEINYGDKYYSNRSTHNELLRMRSPQRPERRHRDLGDLYFNRRRTSDISPPRPSWRHSSSEKNIASESERGRQIVKDKYETRRSRSRKRSLSSEKSVDSDEINERLHSVSKQMKIVEEKIAIPNNFVMIDDLLLPPGRDVRPEKICVILRGPPGSGKSYVAKLIRDKEVEMGGQVRILSIDDYFLHEQQIEEKDPSGKTVKSVYMKYEYDKNLEEKYDNSLQRSFKKNISDGFYSFLIYDAVNAKPDNLLNLLNHAKQFKFQVYLCLLELDPYVCHSRNIHNRSLQDIKEICEAFVPNPTHYKQLDVTTLLQNDCINDVHMEDAMYEDAAYGDYEPTNDLEVECSFTSKWEKMDDATQLAKLDGISKPLRPSISMDDYLQLDEWQPKMNKPGKKSVRWADIEERKEQEKMRAIGFVVGQTDWNRMTDPTMGSSALTKTKYIEKISRPK